MPLLSAAAAALVLASCSAEPPAAPAPRESSGAESGWTLSSQSESEMLALGGDGEASVRLTCTRDGRFRLNVPAFRPVESEERMTFGQGASVETLVADPAGDLKLGGVTAEGLIPERLGPLLSGRIAVNYGSQNSGPHPPIPSDLLRPFIANCAPANQKSTAGLEEPQAGACFVKDGKRVPDISLRAIGTEPFWAADITGRCVTYITPENQQGTRIWTEFDGSRDSGVWSGFYQDQRFVLRTRPDRNCSDGMSDKVYPVGVSLVVAGEERTGCADYR